MAPGITLIVILGVLSVWSAYINIAQSRARRRKARHLAQWLTEQGYHDD